MNFLRRLLGIKPPPSAEDQTARTSAPPAEAPAPEAVVHVGPTEVESIDIRQLTDTGPLVRPRQAMIETAPLETAELEMPTGTRQLSTPEEIEEAFTDAALSFGYAIDMGQVRTNNQDALVAYSAALRSADGQTDFGLFAVADGMGGHLDGEKASALVASTITEQVLTHVYLPLLHQEREADSADHMTVSEVLMGALRMANSAILTEIPGSGTTATLAIIIGNTAHIAHIGDSRAYVISDRNIEQLTRDHSLAQRLFEVGQLTREEMGSFRRRNELYKVLGLTEDVDPDVSSRHLPPGAQLLLCSDGLWGEVPEAIMLDVVLTSPTPHIACKRLVQLANERGGHDNISAVIAQIAG
jgi:serine/threonine protein phosphatase PrpC